MCFNFAKTQAKQHATQNKQGLGRSDVPKLAAGARWCGSKTKLGSDDDEEDEQQGMCRCGCECERMFVLFVLSREHEVPATQFQLLLLKLFDAVILL